MSTLRTIEKQPLEDLLEMGGGFVLDFSNATFAAFFREAAGLEIYDEKYLIYGDSKAKRLRAFWELENDMVVGKVLAQLIELWEYKTPAPTDQQKLKANHCKKIIARLLGNSAGDEDLENKFLRRDLSTVSLNAVPIDPALLPILEARFEEAERCLRTHAPLATIFLCGSVLEGLLLGTARAHPREFNRAANSPRDTTGKVKPYQDWSLAQFIDVACDLGFLTLDVKKFSHSLRDFRNYIHPYQQLTSGFAPDRHTAEICLQVLRAAVAGLSGRR